MFNCFNKKHSVIEESEINIDQIINRMDKRDRKFTIHAVGSRDTMSGVVYIAHKEQESSVLSLKHIYDWYVKSLDIEEILAGNMMYSLLNGKSSKYSAAVIDDMPQTVSKKIEGENLSAYCDKNKAKINKQFYKALDDNDMEAWHKYQNNQDQIKDVIKTQWYNVARLSSKECKTLLPIQVYNYIIGNVDGHFDNLKIQNDNDNSIIPFDFNFAFKDSNIKIFQADYKIIINKTLHILKALRSALGDSVYKAEVQKALKVFHSKQEDVNKILNAGCDKFGIEHKKAEIKSIIQNNLARIEQEVTTNHRTWGEFCCGSKGGNKRSDDFQRSKNIVAHSTSNDDYIDNGVEF